jgi:hypothetical protein
MIVLSVGMPRAGSGWHYNLVHGLMKTTGCADARAIREKYRLQEHPDGSELQYRCPVRPTAGDGDRSPP